ncbi:hypothetical protein QQZ08_012403 [Neonectria magnoliae]|uniref:MACPF domain-containing protein n=1 Tax=Neonectria magnoliae TaxID=2732573 RepID=A0ABR1H2A3_9HYPO
MSSQSFNAGLSFPIGKATVGAKFGFKREQSNKNEQKSKEYGNAITALHLIPTAQINISETTVLLSPDAEADIKRLRQKRRFSDLLSFLMKYDTQVYQTIALGSLLYHAQCLNTTDTQHEEEQTNRVKKSMNASLGIPDLVEVTTDYSKENRNTTAQGEREEHTEENLSWSELGGNPNLIVDPPRWRDSLNEYTNWRPIRNVASNKRYTLTCNLHLNLMVNLRYHAPYLNDLCADENSFSVVLKWTSSSVRESWAIDAEPDTDESKKVLSSFKNSEEALKTANTERGDATTKWNQYKVELEKDKSDWPAWNNGTPEEKKKAEDQEKVLEDAVANRAKEETDSNTKVDSVSQEVAASKVYKNQFLLRNVTSEAWIVGLWTIRRKKTGNAWSKPSGTSKPIPLSAEDFEDLKSTFVQRFGHPEGIEGGCDYITHTLRSQWSNVEANFSMFASEEAEVHSKMDPKFAFDFIDRRISLRGIHYLAVTGEIVLVGGGPLPPQGYTSEAILLQYQEALAYLLFLETQDRDIKSLKIELKGTEEKDVEEAQKVLTGWLKKIYELEVKKVSVSLLRS